MSLKPCLSLLASFAVAVSIAGPAQAQTDAAPEADETATSTAACNLVSQSAMIRLMQCAGAPDDQTLADAGLRACDGQVACGVWFWPEGVDVPAVAPDNHDGLAPDQIASALGVWDNTSANLIRITQN